ncbi:MAG TPA: SPW repeat protein [Burkholderiaceae bacterium]|jgi:heme/copper-type cytochrome/quinol oxidase subunit 3
MKQQLKHWQDPINALIGVWVIASPWFMKFADQQPPSYNATVVGILLVAVALGATFVPRAWEEWSEAILGVWMIASPWALHFANHRDPRLTFVITGVVVTALALWTLGTDKDYTRWMHRGAPQ